MSLSNQEKIVLRAIDARKPHNSPNEVSYLKLRGYIKVKASPVMASLALTDKGRHALRVLDLNQTKKV